MIRKSNDGDTHFKMCKKIAQLTKVIYQLNTQNEDFDARIASMRSTHESEVQTLCKDAERRIEEFRKAFQEAEQQRVRDVQEFRKQCKSEVEEIRRTYTEKVSSMTEELSACKNRFEETIIEVKASDKSKSDEIARRCAAKDTEMANLVREYNDRYKSMLAEQMNAKEALSEELRSLQLKLDAVVAERAAEVEQLSNKLKQAEDAATRMAEDLEHWKQSSNSYKDEVNRLQQECTVLRAQLDAESNSLGASRDVEMALRRTAEEWKKQFEEADQNRVRLEKIVNEKETELAKTQSNLTDMENQINLLKTEENSLRHELRLATEKNEQLTSEVAILEGRVSQLQEKVKETESVASQYRETEASLKTRCEELQRQIDETVRKYQAELDALKIEHEKSLAGVHSASQKTTDTMIMQIRLEMDDLKNKHTEELRQLQERHKQQMEQLASTHETALVKLRTELDAAQRLNDELRTAGQEREAALATELQTEATALQAAKLQAEREAAGAAEREAALQAELKSLRAELTTSQSEVTQLRSELTTSQAELTSSRGELTILQSKLTSSREEVAALQAEVERLRGSLVERGESLAFEHERALRALRAEHDEAQRRLAAAHAEAAAAAEEAHRREVRELVESSGRALEAERAALRRAEADAAEMRRRFEEELAAARRAADADKHNAAEEAGRLDAARREVEAEARRLSSECDRLRAELHSTNEALQRAKAESAEMQNALRHVQGRESELRDAMQRLEEMSNRSRLEVEEQHKAYINNMELRHVQRMQTALDELRTSLIAERNSVQRRGDEALSALQQKYTDAQIQLNSLKLKLDVVTQDLKNRNEEIAREKENMKNVQIEFTSTINAMKEDFEEQRQEMRRQRECDLNEVAAKHKAFVDDLMQQHRSEQDVKDNAIRDLRAELDELRYRYEYRESRPEDVAMINRLIKEGRQKDQALNKALNDMRMYKLELINREENYNKVFGRRPLIASNEVDDKVQR